MRVFANQIWKIFSLIRLIWNIILIRLRSVARKYFIPSRPLVSCKRPKDAPMTAQKCRFFLDSVPEIWWFQTLYFRRPIVKTKVDMNWCHIRDLIKKHPHSCFSVNTFWTRWLILGAENARIILHELKYFQRSNVYQVKMFADLSCFALSRTITTSNANQAIQQHVL